MTKVKVWDTVRSLSDPKFISPVGLATNYVLYNVSGSRLVVDITGSFDGSGKYDTLKKVIDQSADVKESFVEPADVAYVCNNEQVLTGTHRIFGSSEARKMHYSVINN